MRAAFDPKRTYGGARAASILLDCTEVGRPIFDMFAAAGLKRAAAITIAGGRDTTEKEHGFAVPKVTLGSRVQALLHSGDLRTRELQEFRVKYTDAGNATFNVREGERDDLVLALAIAVLGLCESECATCRRGPAAAVLRNVRQHPPASGAVLDRQGHRRWVRYDTNALNCL